MKRIAVGIVAAKLLTGISLLLIVSRCEGRVAGDLNCLVIGIVGTLVVLALAGGLGRSRALRWGCAVAGLALVPALTYSGMDGKSLFFVGVSIVIGMVIASVAALETAEHYCPEVKPKYAAWAYVGEYLVIAIPVFFVAVRLAHGISLFPKRFLF